MLINLSNHPSDKWDKKQLDTAIKKYGEVIDMSFPQISPEATTSQVRREAEDYSANLIPMYHKFVNNFAVHLMGEFTFTFHLVNILKKNGITVLASTTNRIVEEKDGKKVVSFEFIRFREY